MFTDSKDYVFARFCMHKLYEDPRISAAYQTKKPSPLNRNKTRALNPAVPVLVLKILA